MNPSAIGPQTFELATDGSIGRHFWNRLPTRLTIDGNGIRIDYGPWKSRIPPVGRSQAAVRAARLPRGTAQSPPLGTTPKTVGVPLPPGVRHICLCHTGGGLPSAFRCCPSAGLILGPSVTGGGSRRERKCTITPENRRAGGLESRGELPGTHPLPYARIDSCRSEGEMAHSCPRNPPERRARSMTDREEFNAGATPGTDLRILCWWNG